MSRDDNFLARWSQRKREAAKTPEPESAPAQEGQESLPGVVQEEEPFDLELLPKIEDLTPETDITPFMHKAVPEALRNAALRKMWSLDPAIRDYVGEALDYAWDWNTPGGVPGSGGSLSETALEFTRSLFSDPPARENVINAEADAAKDAALQEEAKDRTLASPQAADASPAEAEKPAEIQANLQVTAEQEPAHPVPPQRRHGGALPRL